MIVSFDTFLDPNQNYRQLPYVVELGDCLFSFPTSIFFFFFKLHQDYQAMVAQLEHQFLLGRLSVQGLWFFCQVLIFPSLF